MLSRSVLDETAVPYKKSFCKLIGIGLLVPIFLGGCLQPKPPELSYQDFRVAYNSFTTFDLVTRFKVTNPNPLPVSGKADYQVLIAGKKLFSGSSQPLELDASGQRDLYLNNKLDALELYSSITEMISVIGSGQKEIPFEVDGKFSINLKTGLVNIPVSSPINFQGSIPLPSLPQIKLTGIKFLSMDFQSVRLDIQTMISNQNNFGIDLQQVSYSLAQAGNSIFSGQFDSAVRVPSNGSQQQNFSIEISLQNISMELINSIKSGTADLTLDEQIKSLQ